MFKKHAKVYDVLDDPFWIAYGELFDKYKTAADDSNRPHNPKKYSHLLTSITTMSKWFETNKLPAPSVYVLNAALKLPFSNGDPATAYLLIRFFQQSSQGAFLTNSRITKSGRSLGFCGAENWENVMCYMDLLLFAMFANLELFEPMLFVSNHPHKVVNQLSCLLRVYVNLLRAGHLITTDLTIRICEALLRLGWTEAMSRRQQDSAALFEFLTEVLRMPLLTFKVDIKHGGKFSKDDDQKYLQERMLFVSIPDDLGEIEEEKEKNKVKETEKEKEKNKVNEREKEKEISERDRIENGIESDGTEVKVETIEKDSLEDVTNSFTREDSEPPNSTPPSQQSTSASSSIAVGRDDVLLEECLEHYFSNSISVRRELERRATLESLRMLLEKMDAKQEPTHEVIENVDGRTKSGAHVSTRTRSSTISLWSQNTSLASDKREVNLPAWMFLRLLPFYTDDALHEKARTTKEFANRRPILPLCLKRYSFDAGLASRSLRRIIIPPVITLPDFVADDDNENQSGAYKLILESAVCHRGTQISSGHFVLLVRRGTDNITEAQAYDAKWYLYDDMHRQSRCRELTFKEAFEKEWPYMLFYRLVENEEQSVVVPPAGLRKKYWLEDTVLSPIVSAEDDENVGPGDSAYVDIRNKYFWYVTDKDKNYRKEVPVEGAAAAPAVRRNSQWSKKSEELELLKVESEGSFKKMAKTFLGLPKFEARDGLTASLEKVVERISLDEPDAGHRRRHRHRNAYKRDKCVVV